MPIIDVRQLFSKQWCLQVILDNATVKYDAYKWMFDHFSMNYDAYKWFQAILVWREKSLAIIYNGVSHRRSLKH